MIESEILSGKVNRRQFLEISAGAAWVLMSSCALPLGLGRGSAGSPAGRCSPDLSASFKGVDIAGMLANRDEVFLTSENTDGAIANNHIRTVTLSLREKDGIDAGIWLGYNRQIENTVGFLQLGKGQGVEQCGPVNGKNITGRVNAIAEHNEFGVVVGTDRWVPTDRFGVYIMEHGSGRWSQHLPENPLNGDQTYAVYADREGVLVGTWEGIRRWDGKGWHQENRLMPGGIPQPVHAITRAGPRFWIGLLSGGLYSVNPDNLQSNFLYTHENTPELPSNNIRCLVVGNDNKLWIGGDPGLSFIDPQSGKLTRVDMQNPGDDKEVLGLAVDSGNRILIASNRGLWYVRQQGGAVLRIMDKKANAVVVVPTGYAPGIPELAVAATEGNGLYLIKVP
ncbi:hypothetical protein HYU95_04000 [Candidatus Daviesbacteria bacterium]|nr:hypothetical protein [Candidatus Daviesbacteria bacterium]